MIVKHIGKHNDRKVVVVYRELPDEEHMCLLVYSDVLPRLIHDELMKCVESDIGQSAPDLSDVFFRTLMADGNNILTSLHSNGWLKKVPTNQVLMTPNASSTVRLDELNGLLKQMAQGEESMRRLAELDKNTGMTSRPRDVGEPAFTETLTEALSDADLAKQRLDQAVTMRQQAEALLAEAARLEKEANEIAPAKNVRATKKTTKKQAA